MVRASSRAQAPLVSALPAGQTKENIFWQEQSPVFCKGKEQLLNTWDSKCQQGSISVHSARGLVFPSPQLENSNFTDSTSLIRPPDNSRSTYYVIFSLILYYTHLSVKYNDSISQIYKLQLAIHLKNHKLPAAGLVCSLFTTSPNVCFMLSTKRNCLEKKK